MESEIENYKSEIDILIKELRSFFEKEEIEKKITNLDKVIQDPDFWNRRDQSEKILKEKKNYHFLVNSFNSFKKESNDLYDIFILAKEENNNQILEET